MTENTKRILIMEDERPIGQAMALKLGKSGFEATHALNGEEGLQRLKNDGPFDLMLLDLVMPTMDGFAVLTELQKQKNKIPVLVMTNLSQNEDKQRAIDLGAQGFFVKSNISVSDVIAEVEKILADS